MTVLDDATIHRLVFETFGLRRYTQDSPIQPDVWVTFLKLADRRRITERISLILTPNELPGKDGRPAGGAGLLAERIRSMILGTNRSQERTERGGKGKVLPEERLQAFKIASTARNVVIDVTFEEMLRYLLPITVWWRNTQDKYKKPKQLAKILDSLSKKRMSIRKALVELDDTEFFRFAALISIISLIGQQAAAQDGGAVDVRALVEKLAPARPVDEADDVPGSPSGPTQDAQVSEVAALWSHYKDLAKRTFDHARPPRNRRDTAAALHVEALIWSIQRNRVADRNATADSKSKLAGADAASLSLARLSRQTVKADAAAMLFTISTADLAWAVVDTGIDATHAAFARTAPGPRGATKTRIVATLDFTRLRDLLAEEFDVADLVKKMVWDPATDPGTEAGRIARLQITIDSIRRRNVNGRELDWSLLEPLIRRDPDDTPPPADHHGTHVAGILGGGFLPQGVPGDTEPFCGVCPDIQLYDLRVFGDEAGGDEFTILAAIDYISWINRDPEHPVIHGVNLSLAIRHVVDAHACGRTPICDACNRLVGSGTVVVAAAGNAGFDSQQNKATLGTGYRATSITDPGNAELVITVGATHRNDPHTYGVSYFSSRGPTGDGRRKPDLVAPGEKIRSTVPGGKMLVKDGTSMASPHVSGVCALLMARHREFIGQPMRVKEILVATATDLGRERSFQGAGLVDALRALQSV